MKKKDLNNLKNKSAGELETLTGEMSMQINKAQMDLVSHRAKNTNIVKNLKKTLAQALTFKAEKQLITN